MHLRLEKDGSGVLVVDASTILHLNQTAAEYAYHLILGTPKEQAEKQIARRYRVPRKQVVQDYKDFIEKIETLIQSPDLDPVMYLDMQRENPYSLELSAPLRLDCALTYLLPKDANPLSAPLQEVKCELSTSEWKTILEKAWVVGIPHITFTGGEPTLREDLTDLISHAETIGQISGLFSDGLRFIDTQYLNTLLQTGLDYLLFTLNPENDDSWAALANVLAADLFVAVHMTISMTNAFEARAILQKLAGQGVKFLSLSSAESTLRSTLTELRDFAADLGMTLIWDLPVPYSSFNPVALETQQDFLLQGAGKSWLYIEPDGDVLPGQGIHQVLGNILVDPWEQIWQ
jgi:hypothetical protein